MRPILPALCVFFVCGMSGHAASTVAVPRPFGHLHWEMTRPELAAVYPGLFSNPVRGPRLLHFAYAGCRFVVYFQFIDDVLSHIMLTTEADPAPCRDAVRKDLHDQFGDPESVGKVGPYDHTRWWNPKSNAVLEENAEHLSIEFLPSAS